MTLRAPSLTFTRDSIRRLDQLAVSRFHMPSILLMENAGSGVAVVALRMLAGRSGRIAVYCGPGNNGGDGLVIARHLHNAGCDVRIVLAAPRDRLTGDAAINLDIVRAMRIPFTRRVSSPTLVIDALLGTGLDRPVSGPMAKRILDVNNHRSRGALVLSVDLPSGMNADSGTPLGVAVRADVTATLCGLKAGFRSPSARQLTGRIVVVDIGVPRSLMKSLSLRPPSPRQSRRSASPSR